MSDKRSVATDALEVLGTIITNRDVGRDAIHLAVEPVIAGMQLEPGQHVGINKEGRAFGGVTLVKLVGIVDPFLTHRVNKGEKFLLVVYPRQITSLRHVWSHPDFPEDTPVAPLSDDKAIGRAKMRAWIDDHLKNENGDWLGDEISVDKLISIMRDGGSAFTGYYDDGMPDNLWACWGMATGLDPADYRDNSGYFYCGC